MMKTPLLHQQKQHRRNFCVELHVVAFLKNIITSKFTFTYKFFVFGAVVYYLLSRFHQQNDFEELKSFMEVPLAVTGRAMLALHFSGALKLCDDKVEIDLKDVSPPIRIRFLEPISAGQFGAILKIQAEGEEIAFKMPAYDSEVAIMRTLIGAGMEELPMLKLGGVIHRFDLVEDESENLVTHMKGFGMQYINLPTLYDYMGTEAIGKTLAERKQFLFTEPLRELFRQGIQAMLKMWSVGVLHQDLHANNILVDIQTKKIKIIDFGKAVVPTGSQEVRFKMGTRSDYMRFGLSFVSTLLFAEAFDSSSESPSNAESREAKKFLKQLDPDAAIPFTTADYPDIPEYKAVYEEFRRKHGITGPPAETTYLFARPPPRNVAPEAMRPRESFLPRSSDEVSPVPLDRGGSPSQRPPFGNLRGTGSSPGSFHSLDLGALEVDESNFSSGTRKELQDARKEQEASINPRPQGPSSSAEHNVGVRRRDHQLGELYLHCSRKDCQYDDTIYRRLLTNTFREKCRAYCMQMSGSLAGIRNSYSSASRNVVRDCSHQHLIKDWICEDCLHIGERCFAWSKVGQCTQIRSGLTCLLEGESINSDGTRNKLIDNAIPIAVATDGLPIVPLPNPLSNEEDSLTRASNLASLLEDSEDPGSSSMPIAFHSGVESYLPVTRASSITENSSPLT